MTKTLILFVVFVIHVLFVSVSTKNNPKFIVTIFLFDDFFCDAYDNRSTFYCFFKPFLDFSKMDILKMSKNGFFKKKSEKTLKRFFI